MAKLIGTNFCGFSCHKCDHVVGFLDWLRRFWSCLYLPMVSVLFDVLCKKQSTEARGMTNRNRQFMSRSLKLWGPSRELQKNLCAGVGWPRPTPTWHPTFQQWCNLLQSPENNASFQVSLKWNLTWFFFSAEDTGATKTNHLLATMVVSVWKPVSWSR